ncbi:5,10-methylenetetrahydromethanopterin reductase [[Eubacterium] cellulosolvens]
MKFGVEFVPMNPYWKTSVLTVESEKSGFDHVWITDHYNNRNVYVSLTLAAMCTEKIKLGPGVTNPYMIHPVMTAQAVASLNEVAPGRVVCGIGVGDKTTLATVGVELQAPLSAIRDSVQIIRDMTSGKASQLEGKAFKVSGARFFFKVGNPIPVYVGAQGPKMLALAGEIADGVLINASHKQDIENAVKFVKEGAARTGRTMDKIDVTVYTSFSMAEDPGKAVKAATPVVGYIVAGAPQQLLEGHGISTQAAESIKNDIAKGKWKEAFGQVTPEMMDAFSICGTSDTCLEKIEELGKLGMTQFVAGSPLGPKVRRSIRTFGQQVIPRLKHD